YTSRSYTTRTFSPATSIRNTSTNSCTDAPPGATPRRRLSRWRVMPKDTVMLHPNLRKAARAVLISVLLPCLGCDAPSSGPAAVAQTEAQNPPGAAASAAPATGAPHIVFAEPVYDFGKVEQGEQVTHMFRFTNQGGQELRVESV